MLKKVENQKTQDTESTKLEHVLKSIKNIIDDRDEVIKEQNNSDNTIPDKSVLELTNIVPTEENTAHTVITNEDLISEDVRKKTKSEINRLTKSLNNSSKPISEESLDSMVTQLMNPLIKNWLDNNLPRIVEKVVTEEIQKIIQKP